MGICCGNARIAGSNQKNRWIVFFSQCAPQFSPSPTCTRVRKYRSTKVLSYFRNSARVQRCSVGLFYVYFRTTLYMYVVQVLPEALLFSNLQFYTVRVHVRVLYNVVRKYESTFVRKYESTSIDTVQYFRTSGSIFVRRYYVYVYRRYYVYVYSCSSAAVMYESTFVRKYRKQKVMFSCTLSKVVQQATSAY